MITRKSLFQNVKNDKLAKWLNGELEVKNSYKYINVKHRNITINLTSCTLYKDFPIVVANPIDNETYESLLNVVNSIKYPNEINKKEPKKLSQEFWDNVVINPGLPTESRKKG